MEDAPDPPDWRGQFNPETRVTADKLISQALASADLHAQAVEPFRDVASEDGAESPAKLNERPIPGELRYVNGVGVVVRLEGENEDRVVDGAVVVFDSEHIEYIAENDETRETVTAGTLSGLPSDDGWRHLLRMRGVMASPLRRPIFVRGTGDTRWCQVLHWIATEIIGRKNLGSTHVLPLVHIHPDKVAILGYRDRAGLGFEMTDNIRELNFGPSSESSPGARLPRPERTEGPRTKDLIRSTRIYGAIIIVSGSVAIVTGLLALSQLVPLLYEVLTAGGPPVPPAD